MTQLQQFHPQQVSFVDPDLQFGEDSYDEEQDQEMGKQGVDDQSKAKKDNVKKKKDVYLENVVERSRNEMSNVINPEKRNFTVGKLQNRTMNEGSKVRSVDRVLIESLMAQNFLPSRRADKDPLMEQSHIKDFAMVETLDSHEDNLHRMRQLTWREPMKKEDTNVPKNQLDSTSADNAIASGSSMAS